MRKKAVGSRGSWFASVDGEQLPCVHRHWMKGMYHADPGYVEGESQWPALVSAIRAKKRVILTNDEAFPVSENKHGMGFTRTGYIAVFAVENIEADEGSLRFKLVERICDLQG